MVSATRHISSRLMLKSRYLKSCILTPANGKSIVGILQPTIGIYGINYELGLSMLAARS
jgi:hypothetical protein